MTQLLKQSTAATIKLGPFLDDGDGKTAETGLTISQADIRLSKNGGNIAQTNNATGATHDELGYYDVPLDATDTNTLGRLRVAVHESGALPVWQDFMVVSAGSYIDQVESKTLYVNHTGNNETSAVLLQDTIDAAAAGALIVVSNGLFTFAGSVSLELADDITVRGSGSTVLAFALQAGEFGVKPAVRATLENITVDATTVNGFGFGASGATAAFNTTLRHVRFFTNDECIEVANSNVSRLILDNVLLNSHGEWGGVVHQAAHTVFANDLTIAITGNNSPTDFKAFRVRDSACFYGRGVVLLTNEGTKAGQSFVAAADGEIHLTDSTLGPGEVHADGGIISLEDCEFDRSNTLEENDGVIYDRSSPLKPTVSYRTVNVDADGYLPWNADWDAEVQSEVSDAINTVYGPAELRKIPSSRVLSVKGRGDGTFGVVGRVRMNAGETLWWAVDLAGTHLKDGDLIDAVSAPTITGAQAANLTTPEYGIQNARVNFQCVLSGSALTTDTINVKLTIAPKSGEVLIVTIPVTVLS